MGLGQRRRHPGPGCVDQLQGTDDPLAQHCTDRLALHLLDHQPEQQLVAVGDAELHRIRSKYNTERLHAAIGYVTPDDEHHGRGPGIRRAHAAGMRRARVERIKHNRANKS